ncbi:MAG: biotin synthase BioB [Candidatus Dadabacteria bacterium]|nr:biotin synthase BioB [Candidatus Dadabacteria bacterium]MCZ6684690.1 biotin synthase BioB [Candidatus Dadabacteria bacterium]
MNKEEPVTFEEALGLTELSKSEVADLISLARKVTLKYKGDGVFLRSIISAQTGNCPEDCSFCSQSAHFDTEVIAHPLMAKEKILLAAKQSEKMGAMDFCIVISAKGPTPRIFKQVLEAVDLLRQETNLKVGCSLGALKEEQAYELKEHGVWRYNHNLEACRSFFPNICTTHTYDDRYRTAELVKKVGMNLCSGGILGMGETVRQRLELAFELRELGPSWVPINFINPRPGTPFENMKTVSPFEAVKTISIFRLILPDKILMTAGGREVTLRDLQAMGLLAGANAMILGNYLTTSGRTPEEDLRMLDDLEMPIRTDVN